MELFYPFITEQNSYSFFLDVDKEVVVIATICHLGTGFFKKPNLACRTSFKTFKFGLKMMVI
jgi:hypothetical protein